MNTILIILILLILLGGGGYYNGGPQALLPNGEGGNVAREAKAMLPSACVWLDGPSEIASPTNQKAIQFAVRSHDPFRKIVETWLIRRLSPESNPIEIADLPEEHDEENASLCNGL